VPWLAPTFSILGIATSALHTSIKAKLSTVDPLNNAKATRGKSKSWPLGPVHWSAQSHSQPTTPNIPIGLTGSPNTLDPVLPFACPKSLSRTNLRAGNWDSWTLAQGHHIPIHLVGCSTLGLGLPGPHLELPNVPKPNPKGQVMTPPPFVQPVLIVHAVLLCLHWPLLVRAPGHLWLPSDLLHAAHAESMHTCLCGMRALLTWTLCLLPAYTVTLHAMLQCSLAPLALLHVHRLLSPCAVLLPVGMRAFDVLVHPSPIVKRSAHDTQPGLLWYMYTKTLDMISWPNLCVCMSI
jgi:hypothetical protein